ncbi:uncharacterized protein LOC102162489 [Sus scrofa]|uniref:uncharacterized protein LOC102162489 n=1 Tax=Sus scrofa TaxID=9823 RepID=UPI000A2AF0AB|nr:uncharacterized protein LOC102162489 [Sus scrofa]
MERVSSSQDRREGDSSLQRVINLSHQLVTTQPHRKRGWRKRGRERRRGPSKTSLQITSKTASGAFWNQASDDTSLRRGPSILGITTELGQDSTLPGSFIPPGGEAEASRKRGLEPEAFWNPGPETFAPPQLTPEFSLGFSVIHFPWRGRVFLCEGVPFGISRAGERDQKLLEETLPSPLPCSVRPHPSAVKSDTGDSSEHVPSSASHRPPAGTGAVRLLPSSARSLRSPGEGYLAQLCHQMRGGVPSHGVSSHPYDA